MGMRGSVEEYSVQEAQYQESLSQWRQNLNRQFYEFNPPKDIPSSAYKQADAEVRNFYKDLANEARDQRARQAEFTNSPPRGGQPAPTASVGPPPSIRNEPLGQYSTQQPARPVTPSTGAPPPTIGESIQPRGSFPTGGSAGGGGGATTATRATVPPPTAAPPTPITQTRSPSGIPGGAIRPPNPVTGLAVGAGIGGVIDFGGRLAAGQSVEHAALGGLANAAGSLAIGGIGFALGGPVGGMVGSMIGGMLANRLFDAAFPSSAEPNIPYEPISGVNGKQFATPQLIEFYAISHAKTAKQWVLGFFIVPKGSFYKGFSTLKLDYDLIVSTYTLNPADPKPSNIVEGELYLDPATLNFPNGLPDVLPETPGRDRRSLPRSSPVSPSVSSPPSPVAIPGGPGSSIQPGGPRLIPSGKSVDAPSEASNRGSNLPALEPNPKSSPVPGTSPTVDPLQSPIPQPANRGQSTPIIGGLTNGGSPDKMGETAAPSSTPRTVRVTTPTPDAQKPPQPQTPTPEQANNQILDRLNGLDAQMTALLATIGTLLVKPLNPTSPIDLNGEEFKNAVAAGNCRTTQPGNCMRKEFDDLGNQNQSNSNKLDNLLDLANLGGTAGINAKLDKIDTKLGPQIPNGGISGKLGKVFGGVQKLWDLLQVDRVLNILSWLGIMHNALMLSNNVGQTLFSVIDTWLDALGFKVTKLNDEGESEDVSASELIGGYTLAFANTIFGKENVAKLTISWQKANRIYQAATNMLDAIQGMLDAARSIAEDTAGKVGKIGNALVNAGTVFEDAYGRMQERVTARSARQKKVDDFLQGITRVEDMLSTTEQIGSNVVSFQDGMTELTESRTEYQKAKTDAEKFLSDQAEAEKLASKSPDIEDLAFDLAPQTEED